MNKKVLSTLLIGMMSVGAITGCQKGDKGDKGDDGISSIVTIGENGNWFINGVDTTVKATGSSGDKGDKGNDAVAPLVRINETTNEWEISMDNGVTWESTFVNATGGVDDNSFPTYTISYEYSVLSAKTLFNNYTLEQQVRSNKRLLQIPTPKEEYINDFDGWYIEGTDIKVDQYSFINGNVALVDRWKNYPSIASGLYQNGELSMTWEEIITKYPFSFTNNLTVIKESPDAFKDLEGVLVIDSSIVEIEEKAFKNADNLKGVIISEGVTKIGYEAFADSDKLESVLISSSVTTINPRAIFNCVNLKSIIVSENNPNYSSEEDVLFNKEKTILIKYPDAKPNKSYKIPTSVTEVEHHAFVGSKELTGLIISENVIKLGEHAIASCENLKNIIILSGLQQIDYGNFGNCENLENIIVDETNSYYYSENGVLFNKEKTALIKYPSKKENTAYTIPSSVTKIEGWAFEGCANLINVSIPEGVTQINAHSFYNCSNLSSITIPSSILTVEGHAFLGCVGLESVYLNGISDGKFINTDLLSYPTTVYVKTNLIVEGVTDLEEDFTKQDTSDVPSYDKYIKN